MELKLDVKTLVVGIVLGVILAATLGANGGSADKTDYGIAIPRGGYALVRTASDAFYIVEAEKGEAERVEDATRGSKNKYFYFTSPEQPQGKPKDY